ncbi:MAG: DNA repair protein RecO [Holosporales bacterium]
MIEWRDEGVLLGAKSYGEKNLLLHVLTDTRGYQKGMTYKGRTSPSIQMGSHLSLTWKGRLDTHLGRFDLEFLPSPYVFFSFEKPAALRQLQQVCALLMRVLPENHPYPGLLKELLDFLNAVPTERADFAQAYFEVYLLESLGYGLDLSACVLTGETENLTHVSPKSGRAVSFNAAQPYLNQLLELPAFLRKSKTDFLNSLPSPEDLANSLKLTRFFIEKHLAPL